MWFSLTEDEESNSKYAENIPKCLVSYRKWIYELYSYLPDSLSI